jgi:O-antigen ligase
VAVAVGTLAVVLGVAWVGVGGLVEAFESRGIQGSRFDLWADMLPLVPSFPLFGVGMNAFAAAYPTYQTVWRTEWIGEAHDDYLQTLLDLGLLGVALVFPLLAQLFRRAAARASRSPLSLGLAAHALVDFNWQIPANAATYVSLAGLALAGEGPLETSRRRS